jgi:hypothetical protein
MGDLIRKYMALDGYVRRYLPIRGYGTMSDTLRHYRVADAPSFRLVLNAVEELMMHARAPRAASLAASAASGGALAETLRQAAAALPSPGAGAEGALLGEIAAAIKVRIVPLATRAAEAMRHPERLVRLKPAYDHLLLAMAAHGAGSLERTAAQSLMELELGVTLLECWTRVAELDLALAEAA